MNLILNNLSNIQLTAGVKFLCQGLHAMGIFGSHFHIPSTAMVLALVDMYSEMGDRLALQYGGSEAHKKMNVSSQQGNGATSSRKATKHGELLTSIKRYYSNAFTDRVKQDAMNLFLGYYIPNHKETPLWELDSDFYLHNRLLSTPQHQVDKIQNNFTLVDIEFDSETIVQSSSANDCNNHYYYISHPDNPLLIKEMNKIEKRKLKVKNRFEKLKEALSQWWHQALFEYDMKYRWMSLPPPPMSGKQMTPFDERHHTWKYSSFDSIFKKEFLNPIDASHISYESNTTVGYWGPRKALTSSDDADQSNANTSATATDDHSNSKVIQVESVDKGTEECTGSSHEVSGDSLGFDFGGYFKRLRSKAKTIVDDWIGRENQSVVRRRLSDATPSHVPDERRGTSESRFLHYQDLRQTSQTELLYSNYVMTSLPNEQDIRKEYEAKISDLLIPCNDVRGMQALAEKAHIGSVSKHQELFPGIHQYESASWTAGCTSIAVAYAEASGSSEDKGDSGLRSIDDTQRSVCSGESLQQRSPLEVLPVEASCSLQRSLEGLNILSSFSNSSLIGLYRESCDIIKSNVDRKSYYSNTVDPQVLETRSSATLTDDNILSYCNLFEKDFVATDLKTIKYIYGDQSIPNLNNTQSMHSDSFRNFADELEIGYLKQTDKKWSSAGSMTNNSQQGKVEAHIEERLEATSFNKIPNFEGYTEISPGIFSKNSSPTFLMNESAIRSFLSSPL